MGLWSRSLNGALVLARRRAERVVLRVARGVGESSAGGESSPPGRLKSCNGSKAVGGAAGLRSLMCQKPRTATKSMALNRSQVKGGERIGQDKVSHQPGPVPAKKAGVKNRLAVRRHGGNHVGLEAVTSAKVFWVLLADMKS